MLRVAVGVEAKKNGALLRPPDSHFHVAYTWKKGRGQRKKVARGDRDATVGGGCGRAKDGKSGQRKRGRLPAKVEGGLRAGVGDS